METDQPSTDHEPMTRVPDTAVLSMWVVCDHPSDHPDVVVARRHEISDGGHQPTGDLLTGATLEEVREQIPVGFINIGRSDEDDPVIVESWV